VLTVNLIANNNQWHYVTKSRSFLIQNHLITLSASSSKRNLTVWHPSVCLSRLLSVIGRDVHTQRDSPGGSTQRVQRTFSPAYYVDGHLFGADALTPVSGNIEYAEPLLIGRTVV